MQRPAYFFILCFFIFLSNLSAQTAWTVQQCIDYSLSHNITIKQSELNVESNKVLVNQSTAALFPSLNGFASNNYYYGRSIDPNTNTFTNDRVRSNSLSLSSSMPLFEGLQLQNYLRQSKLNYISGKFDLQKVKNDIALNVATVYLQVLYNKELLGVSESQRNATKYQRDRTKRMEELGSVSRSSLLDMEAQLAADEVRLITAQAQLDQAMLTLQQLMELDSVKDFRIVQPELAVTEMNASYTDVQAIYLSALSNQPDIKSYEYKVMSADKGLTIAKGGIYPRLTLSGSLSSAYTTSKVRILSYTQGSPVLIGYTTDSVPVPVYAPNFDPVFEKTPFNTQLDENLGKSIGFNLTVPIFNNWSTRTNIKKAEINLQQTRLGFESTKKSLYKSIQQAVQDAASGYQKYLAGEKSIQATQESVNANEQKFNAGMISSYDYLLAKNNLVKAQSDLLQAKYDYIFRLKVLDFYMGKALAF